MNYTHRSQFLLIVLWLSFNVGTQAEENQIGTEAEENQKVVVESSRLTDLWASATHAWESGYFLGTKAVRATRRGFDKAYGLAFRASFDAAHQIIELMKSEFFQWSMQLAFLIGALVANYYLPMAFLIPVNLFLAIGSIDTIKRAADLAVVFMQYVIDHPRCFMGYLTLRSLYCSAFGHELRLLMKGKLDANRDGRVDAHELWLALCKTFRILKDLGRILIWILDILMLDDLIVWLFQKLNIPLPDFYASHENDNMTTPLEDLLSSSRQHSRDSTDLEKRLAHLELKLDTTIRDFRNFDHKLDTIIRELQDSKRK